MCAANTFLQLGLHQTRVLGRSFASSKSPSSSVSSLPCRFASSFKFSRPGARSDGWNSQCISFRLAGMDEGAVDFSTFDEWADGEVTLGDDSRLLSSSEGDESDSELLIIPSTDGDLPSRSSKIADSSYMDLSVTTHLLGNRKKRRRTSRIRLGTILNFGLITFLTVLLLFIDWCSWRIVRLPFPSFHLTRPFCISAILSAISGFVFVPILDSLKIHQVLRKEGPALHSSKTGTPTMGGLFFIPVGVTVAIALTGFASLEVYGASAATFVFAAIGLLDDVLCLVKNDNYGLAAWHKLMLQAFVGICFSFWLDSTSLSSPYSMKTLMPLPAPFGLVYLGRIYLFLSAFCFTFMGNGINLTDGLDGLAGGTAAFAFIGMSIAILPICSDLSVFGASMAGACVGFLLHNRYKASIFMGDTGSLALGGALASMSACTGMFFPLFIVSAIFVLEATSVVIQVCYFKATKRLRGVGVRFFRMAPLHHHLELCGLKEPHIVAIAYIVSFILTLAAGYVGLISA